MPAEKIVSINPPKTGDVTGYLDLLRQHIENETTVKALLEPQPIDLHEPHVRVLAKGFSFRFEDTNASESKALWTVKLDVLVTLLAYGDGPDMFLEECLSASFRINRLFERPFTVPVLQFGFSVSSEKKTGGQFFKNEEDGKKPYLYEENFDVSMYFPYMEAIKNGI